MKTKVLMVLASVAIVMSMMAGHGFAIDLWYDFEGDSGLTATDKLTDDGAQDGALLGNVTFQTEPPGNVPWGLQAGLFGIPPEPQKSVIEVPGSGSATGGGIGGENASYTLAMHVDNKEETYDHTRLFSSYRGYYAVETDRIVLDYDPSGSILSNGIRAIVNNVAVTPDSMPGGLSTPGYHHYALTVEQDLFHQDGNLVTIYVDGTNVASGRVGTGNTNSANILIGEDWGPASGGGTLYSEQLIGNVDDVLVIDQVLSAAQIAGLAGGATVQSTITPTGSYAVNYNFEGTPPPDFRDQFTADGVQDGIGSGTTGVDFTAVNAKEGVQSAYLDLPPSSHLFSQIETGVTGTDLGSAFTMSAVINVDGDGYIVGKLTRLFSTYSGAGSPSGRLVFDFEPDASTHGYSIRCILPAGTNVNVNSPFTYSEDHTLTATYDDGVVKLYIDGVEVVSGGAGGGGAVNLGEYVLMIGEDLGGGVGEQFIGDMDDVLILDRALSAANVLQLHTLGADAFLGGSQDPIPGDANGDNVVNDADASILAAHWQQTGMSWGDGDFNGDNVVNDADASILAAHWQESQEGTAPVPEPGCVVLLLGGLVSLFVWRRRSR